MVADACNTRTQDGKTGGSRVLGQLRLKKNVSQKNKWINENIYRKAANETAEQRDKLKMGENLASSSSDRGQNH